LLSLASEDLHGYGIMQKVSRQSGGQYKLGPGTLYDNLQKLMDRQLVREINRNRSDEDTRRRYYGITASGRNTLSAEIDRLESIVREAIWILRHGAGDWGEIDACEMKTNADALKQGGRDSVSFIR
jgi:DNA-binding PadR family transcriptional regulator